jgi:hypothetical protein
MKRMLSRLGWLALGVVATSLALGPTVRHQMAREATTEVALSGTQAFVHIPVIHVGYEKSPAAIGLAFLMSALSPWAVTRTTHRVDHQTIIVIDAHGARTMKFQGVSGPFQVTSDGPVVLVGDQFCRWTGRALVTLTPEEGVAVQRDYTGPVRPPWSKRDIAFREPAVVVPFTIEGASYQLEAHAAGEMKTLTLIDPRGGRQVVWSLDEAVQSPSADQSREQFH